MTDHETIEMELSLWWGVATLVLMVGGGTILIARNIGPQAIEILLYTSLMLIFLAGGVLLGTLATQALGSSQRWGLSDDETPLISKPGSQATLLSLNENSGKGDTPLSLEEREVDPFYEILKRNRSSKKAA